MKTYARISQGRVVELLTTSQDVSLLFHPSLQWVEVTNHPPLVGWAQQQDGSFSAPTQPPASLQPPTLAELEAQLAALAAQIAALLPHS